MALQMRGYQLKNGLVVEIVDDTKQYYADFHHIRLTIRAEVPVKEEYLAPLRNTPHYATIVERLLPGVTYLREIVKAGVEGKRVAAEKSLIVESFEKNALPYFARDDFPERYVQARFREIEKELLPKGQPKGKKSRRRSA